MISRLVELGTVNTPAFAEGFTYMQKVKVGVHIPDILSRWVNAIGTALFFAPMKEAWVTVDERRIPAGETHRRSGAHVDGNFYGAEGWTGPGGWQRNDQTGGLFLLASSEGSVAYTGEIDDVPSPWVNEGAADSPSDGGDCSHMNLGQLVKHRLLPNILYWMNSGGIHESIPVTRDTERSLLRVTLPHNCPQLA
jgi:hypothetical protein